VRPTTGSVSSPGTAYSDGRKGLTGTLTDQAPPELRKVAKDIRHRLTSRRRGIDSAIDGALVMERYGHPSVDAAKRRLLRAFEFHDEETGSATGSVIR
jgi:hypothetical protein